MHYFAINEARCRSVESRGACALSDRCGETRHRDTPTKTLVVHALSRSRARYSKTSAISTHHSPVSKPGSLHSCTPRSAVLCENLQILLLFFFLIPFSFFPPPARGQPASSQARSIIGSIIAASQRFFPTAIHTESQKHPRSNVLALPRCHPRLLADRLLACPFLSVRPSLSARRPYFPLVCRLCSYCCCCNPSS